MAEPCDPEVLHARVSVLEASDKRHDGDIKQLWETTTSLQLCATCIPGIQTDLKEIKINVQNLNNCKIAEENVARGQKTFWEEWKWIFDPIIKMAMGAIILILWASAMHLHIGAK